MLGMERERQVGDVLKSEFTEVANKVMVASIH